MTAVARVEPATGAALDAYLVVLQDAVARFIAVHEPAEPALPRSTAELPRAGGVFAGLELDAPTEAVIAAAWWSAADPRMAIGFGFVHDDIGRRYPSLAALRLLLAPYGLEVALTLPDDDGPVADGLLRPVLDPDSPVRLTATAAELLDGRRPPVARTATVPPRLRPAVAQTQAMIAAGHRVSLRCADADDGPTVARAVAAELSCALEVGSIRPAAETALLDRLGVVLPAGPDESAPTRLCLTAAGASVSPGRQVVDVPAIDTADVHRAWRRALAASGLDTREAVGLTARMRLSEATVEQLHATARAAASVAHRHLRIEDLHAAVRRHPQHRLDGMARLLPPSVSLDGLVLAESTRAGLRDLLAHARHGEAVSAHWPGRRGRGIVALLYGPSGTGKTAATEALAAELDRDLWIVDLAQVVSKWLGETSRNLDRLLGEASRSGAVLLFDEAEGLFGRRAEVSDARDRYANLEIDHLLQRIELHDGLVVLTSNRPAALDEGFQRRIRLAVRFELPDHAGRERIWSALLPADQLADGTSLAVFAAAELSGASIRAAAQSALVFAAEDRTPVDATHLDRAVTRELEKSGRTWTPQPEPATTGGTAR